MLLLSIYGKGADLESMDLLLASGSDLDIRDKEQNTALFKACENESLLQLNRLLKLSCSKEILNKHGDSPLNIVTRTRNLVLIKTLLENGADINFVDAKKRNPLHWTISQQTKEATNDIENYLLANGCNP